MENAFLSAMKFRFACKKFDSTRVIACEEFDQILESGRLSPSSFGMEPTRLLVITNKQMREELRKHCWNQEQITHASHLVIYLSKVADMMHTSDYAARMFDRKSKDKQLVKAYKDERYAGFLRANGYVDSASIFQWSARQAYIMASSMMNCAAFMGIDSCAIEGFEKNAVERYLKLDTFKEQVSLIMTFGYRLEEPKRPSPRIDMSEFVQYLR